MRLSRALAFGLLLAALSTPCDARCAPYPAYVYEGEVLECSVAADPEIFANPDALWDARVREDMERTLVSITVVSVGRFAQVARCDWERSCESAITPWDTVTPAEFRFQLDGECSDLEWEQGQVKTFNAVWPCCDSNIARSVRCALGLRVIMDPPEWAQGIIDGDVDSEPSRPN